MSQLQPVLRSQSAPPFSRLNPMHFPNQPVPELNPFPPLPIAAPNPALLLPFQPATPDSPSPFSPQPVAALSGKSEGKSSKMSKRKRVEFIPPVEYIDVSDIFIRFVQLLILCELAFFIYETASSLAQIHIYIDFLKVLTSHLLYAATVTPLSIVLAAVFSYRSIQGLFAVNFTTAAEPARALYGLIALICSRLVYGGVIVAAGFVLNSEVASEATKNSIAKNLAHLIHYATKELEYMEEINRIQQEFQCCGVRTNIEVGNATYTSSNHPWNMWFATYSLDETYPNTVRELYSLPWSCCNMTANVKCEHIGISRYLRKFETPTDFSDVEAALEVEELKWNPTDFDHYLTRNEIAKATLYSSDCSEEMFKHLAEEVSHLRDLMFQTGSEEGKSVEILANKEVLSTLGVRSADLTTSIHHDKVKRQLNVDNLYGNDGRNLTYSWSDGSLISHYKEFLNSRRDCGKWCEQQLNEMYVWN